MGREIRRVPPDWEHPIREGGKRNYIPLNDEDYETAAHKWQENCALWHQGKHEAQSRGYEGYFWDYEGPPPDEDAYRERKWSPEEATHIQVYETVSEGTPVSPHFATADELVDYLCTHGDFWDQQRGDGPWKRASAEAFVKAGYAPSMVISNGRPIESRDAAAEMQPE